MESALDLILLATAWTHVLLAPYTKVEESFNLHAAHDVFFYGVSKSVLRKYDHFMFPGVVPRSFVGSLFLGGIARPVVALLSSIGLVKTKLDVQIIIRLILATCNALVLNRIKASIWRRFGRRTAVLFVLFSAAQFHLPFWMGRTLPNMLALLPFNEALAQMISIDGSSEIAVVLLTFAAVVFRAELAVYLAVYGFFVLLRSRVKFKRLFFIGICTAGASIVFTVCIDSYFWQRKWMWPELQGLNFNVVEGKSIEWGTSPFYSYWLIHLPKILTGAFPFFLLGVVVDKRARSVSLPAITFVTIISFLSHKEWRFIVYVVPIFNLCAACAFTWLHKIWGTRLFGVLFGGTILGTLAITSLLTHISYSNYPGGEALYRLNQIKLRNVNVHVGNLAAQSGASLFLQEHSSPFLSLERNLVARPGNWTYDKTEHLLDLHPYSHAIVESLDIVPDWKIETEVYAFDGLSKHGITYRPKLWIVSNPAIDASIYNLSPLF
ncbi:hypothetical protein CPB86DRAFT_868979 [Serendipita vermifera]|nr:hypothetical protein CPB86DRAFT_868979 [Serendipita vermifera]